MGKYKADSLTLHSDALYVGRMAMPHGKKQRPEILAPGRESQGLGSLQVS
jgi:hypothetical protein